MYFPDLWQLLGSTQLAELTALVALALSLRPNPSKKICDRDQ
jgi:hypothetical protein